MAGASEPQPELDIELYGLDLYRDLARWHTIGLRQHGIAHIAMHANTMAALQGSYQRARTQLGDEHVTLLSSQQLHALAPIVVPQQIAGALLLRNAFSIVAADAVHALAHEFVALGGELRLGTAVDEIVISDGRVRGVVVGDRTLHAATVVIAAGAWLHELVHRIGVTLPLLATQAARFVSQPLDAVPDSMPMLMFPDYHNLYLRVEQGGLLIGCEEIVIHPPTLQHDIAALQRGQTPQNRAAGVAPLADTTHHYHLWLARAFAHVVPLLATIAAREVRVGYPTRVPDMRHILGQAGTIGGLFLIGADLECGMTRGPGLGRMLAKLVTTETSTVDTRVYQPDRW
ncbi:FAD-binding oxidoreductase [Candidatus Gracilibacteria bacterium]|nr:FAD-binding oxidoreductase [Candidatus Gracilibacteria bacterium]